MRTLPAMLVLTLAACGGDDDDVGGGDGGSSGGDAGAPLDGDDGLADAGMPGQPPDDLGTATGCQGIFNPNQLLRFELTMAGGDWSSLKSDMSNSVYYPAQLSCNGEAPVSVGARRKRSGGTDKPGVKIDIDWAIAGQFWHGLKKLSLENGISEGSADAGVRDVLAEYLGWRVQNLSGAMSSRVAFVELVVNGETIGAYTNVEVVDKRFLRSRVVDDSGWLYKRSGSVEDGYKTNETQANPYEADWCFFSKSAPCAPPAGLETWLPAHLHIDQMLRFGGANALIANQDSPLAKDNNFYFYDYAGGRVYFAWDLDTTMLDSGLGFFRPSVGGGVDFYLDVMFAHWEDDYDAMWTGLVAGPLALSVIQAEIDRAVSVGGATLDADANLSGSAADAGSDLSSWWGARHPAVSAELSAHP